MSEPFNKFINFDRVDLGIAYRCTNRWSWNLVRARFRSHQLLVFFILAFLVAWLIWLPMLASARVWVSILFPAAIIWVAGIAPIGAAILVEWFFRGKPGIRHLYSRFLIRRVSIKWYCAAAGLPVCIGLVQILMTGGPISIATIALAFLTLIKGLLYAPVAAFEEVGWRGFALPRLQTRFNALIASLVLGLIWSVWHLPLFWLGLSGYSGISFVWWSVEILAVSILVTWLFNNGRGSLWLPCLFHATANMIYATLTHIQGNSTVSLVVAVIAAAVVLVFGSTNLSRTQPRQSVS